MLGAGRLLLRSGAGQARPNRVPSIAVASDSGESDAASPAAFSAEVSQPAMWIFGIHGGPCHALWAEWQSGCDVGPGSTSQAIQTVAGRVRQCTDVACSHSSNSRRQTGICWGCTQDSPHVGLAHAAGSLLPCQPPDLCTDELRHAILLGTLSCQIAALTAPGVPACCCSCRGSCTS